MHARQRSIFYCAASMTLLAPIGCSHDPVIPGSARVVTSGQGRLRYVAEENGSVYLLDTRPKKTIFKTHIGRGERITVDPDRDLIDLARHPLDHKPALSPDRDYRLYFDREN